MATEEGEEEGMIKKNSISCQLFHKVAIFSLICFFPRGVDYSRICSTINRQNIWQLDSLWANEQHEFIWELWQESTGNKHTFDSLPSLKRCPALRRLHVDQLGSGCLQHLGQETNMASDIKASQFLTSGVENSGSSECVGLSRTSMFCVLFNR